MSSSQAVLGTASCSTRMTSPDSREKVSVSQLTGRRNPHLPPPRNINTSLPTSRRTCRVPPAKRTNHARPVAGSLGPLHPRPLTPQVIRRHLIRQNTLLKQRNSQKNMTPRTRVPPPNTRTGPTATRAADMALTRRVAPCTSMLCLHDHVLPLLNAHGRNLMWMIPPIPQVRVHTPATGALLGA